MLKNGVIKMINEKISTFSERFREAMSARSMRQADIIKKTGISSSNLSSYLSGRYKPKQKTLAILAYTLDVSEAWLQGYDVPMERERENKNDDLSKIVVRLRRDNDFFAACRALYEMNAQQLQSVRDLIAAFTKK